jgi:hypothetical protein
MKNLSLFSLLIFASLNIFSQSTFVKVFGVNTSGNYVSENFDGDFICAIDSGGIYNVRVDSSGNVIWNNFLEFSNDSRSHFIKHDPNGGFIFGGANEDSTMVGSPNGIILKLDDNGDTLWSKSFPSSQFGSYCRFVIPTMDNNYLVGLYDDDINTQNSMNLIKFDTIGTELFNYYISNNGTWPASILQDIDSNFVYAFRDDVSREFIRYEKISNSGILLDSSQFKDSTSCVCVDGASVCEAKSNGYLVAGTYSRDMLLLRINTAMDTIWSKIIAFTNPCNVVSIEQDQDSGFVILFNSANSLGLFHINQNGDSLDLNWHSIYSFTVASSMDKCIDGGYIITGYTSDSTGNYPHAFLIKTDSLCNTGPLAATPVWTNHYEANAYSESEFVLVDDSCNVYITGWSVVGTPHEVVTIKYDLYGDTVWLRKYWQGLPTQMKFDNSNNLVITAFVSDSVGLKYQWVILKYNSNGDLLYSSIYQNTNLQADSVEYPVDFDFDSMGNIYVIGYSSVQGFAMEKIIKYDNQLNIIWESIDSTSISKDFRPVCIEVSLNDSVIYYTVETNIVGELDSYIKSYNVYSGLTAGYNFSGNFVSMPYLGSYEMIENHMIIDSNNIYLSVTLDTLTGPGVYPKSAIYKFDHSLNLLWFTISNTDNSGSGTLIRDIFNNKYHLTYSNSGVVLEKYSINDAILWRRQLGDISDCKLIITQDSLADIYIFGTIDFNDEIFICKWNSDGIKYSGYPLYYYYDFGGGPNNMVNNAIVDKFGNYYITGGAWNGFVTVYQTVKFASQHFNFTIHTIGSDSGYVDHADYYQWYWNGTLLIGENNQGIHFVNDGDYYCQIIKNCSAFTSDTIHWIHTSTKQLSMQTLDIMFYPNPANDKIYYMMNNKYERSTFHITDCLGNLLHEEKIRNNSGELNVHFLPGVYYIQVFNEEGKTTKKIIIN